MREIEIVLHVTEGGYCQKRNEATSSLKRAFGQILSRRKGPVQPLNTRFFDYVIAKFVEFILAVRNDRN